MSLEKMSPDKMSLDKMSRGKMSLDKMSLYKCPQSKVLLLGSNRPISHHSLNAYAI